MKRKQAEKCAFVIWKINFVLMSKIELLPLTQYVKFIDKHFLRYLQFIVIQIVDLFTQAEVKCLFLYFVHAPILCLQNCKQCTHICQYAAVDSFAVHFISICVKLRAINIKRICICILVEVLKLHSTLK